MIEEDKKTRIEKCIKDILLNFNNFENASELSNLMQNSFLSLIEAENLSNDIESINQLSEIIKKEFYLKSRQLIEIRRIRNQFKRAIFNFERFYFLNDEKIKKIISLSMSIPVDKINYDEFNKEEIKEAYDSIRAFISKMPDNGGGNHTDQDDGE